MDKNKNKNKNMKTYEEFLNESKKTKSNIIEKWEQPQDMVNDLVDFFMDLHAKDDKNFNITTDWINSLIHSIEMASQQGFINKHFQNIKIK